MLKNLSLLAFMTTLTILILLVHDNRPRTAFLQEFAHANQSIQARYAQVEAAGIVTIPTPNDTSSIAYDFDMLHSFDNSFASFSPTPPPHTKAYDLPITYVGGSRDSLFVGEQHYSAADANLRFDARFAPIARPFSIKGTTLTDFFSCPDVSLLDVTQYRHNHIDTVEVLTRLTAQNAHRDFRFTFDRRDWRLLSFEWLPLSPTELLPHLQITYDTATTIPAIRTLEEWIAPASAPAHKQQDHLWQIIDITFHPFNASDLPTYDDCYPTHLDKLLRHFNYISDFNQPVVQPYRATEDPNLKSTYHLYYKPTPYAPLLPMIPFIAR